MERRRRSGSTGPDSGDRARFKSPAAGAGEAGCMWEGAIARKPTWLVANDDACYIIKVREGDRSAVEHVKKASQTRYLEAKTYYT